MEIEHVVLEILLDGDGIRIGMDGIGIVRGLKERQTQDGVLLIGYFTVPVERYMVLINSGHQAVHGVPQEHIHELLTEFGIKNEIGEVVISGHGIVLEKMEEVRHLVNLCIDAQLVRFSIMGHVACLSVSQILLLGSVSTILLQ
jgi:hypothetical protein